MGYNIHLGRLRLPDPHLARAAGIVTPPLRWRPRPVRAGLLLRSHFGPCRSLWPEHVRGRPIRAPLPMNHNHERIGDDSPSTRAI